MQLVNALSITATTGSIVLMARAFDNPIDPGLAVSGKNKTNTKTKQNESKRTQNETKQALSGWSQHVLLFEPC